LSWMPDKPLKVRKRISACEEVALELSDRVCELIVKHALAEEELTHGLFIGSESVSGFEVHGGRRGLQSMCVNAVAGGGE
jgi:hypothetical protein